MRAAARAGRTARERPSVAGARPSQHDHGLSFVLEGAATLRRWGVRTLGALAALPCAEVHERLGEPGSTWQRWARGDDDGPLVPWRAAPVFEATLELEWPIEGLEPLSFVLSRMLEPLAARLEQADRGAVTVRTALHLTTRAVYVRAIPLPAPMRDPKTLRTLILLDLESHPPDAAIDRVHVSLDPHPGRVVQWTLFERAQPAPEQVSTLVARLTALVGDGHVGAPALVNTWRPGAFAMTGFAPGHARTAHRSSFDARRGSAHDVQRPDRDGRRSAVNGARVTLSSRCALRRFRLPVPVRVRVEDGRPVRVTTDRHGIAGGAIVQAAGPWRTSGEWWAGDTVARHERRAGAPEAGRHGVEWDRDEWDIAMTDGTVYRLSVEREVGQWSLEGILD